MKNKLICTTVLIGNLLFSQVGINTNAPDPSAALDISSEVRGSNKKGILIPRIRLLSRTDNSNNPARGLLVYNIKTQNDVVKDNFYYFDGTRWNPLISNNDNKTKVFPELAAALRLEKDIKVYGNYRTRQKIPVTFDRDLIDESVHDLQGSVDPNLIDYDIDNGIFTVKENGIYGVTLQVGLYKVSKEQDIIIGLIAVDRTNRTRRTYNPGDWLSRATFATVYDEDNTGELSGRTFKTYTTYIKFSRGEKFKAAVALDAIKAGEKIQGIQTGPTGDGNVTNISIIKY